MSPATTWAACAPAGPTPSAFARLVVDYYGAPTPIPQMASVNVPEARMAVIKPYDSSQLDAIEKAIRDSDLGVNPTNDGTLIRVVFPQLTEERRRDLVKVAKGKGEDAKVSIRSVRRHAKDVAGQAGQGRRVRRGRRAPRRGRAGQADRALHRARSTSREGQGSRTARGLMRPATPLRPMTTDPADPPDGGHRAAGRRRGSPQARV